MTPRQAEIAAAVAEHGSYRKAAKALGINPRNVMYALKRARTGEPAWSAQAEARGFSAGNAGWIKWPATEDQPGASVYVGRAPVDAAEGIRAAFEAYEGRVAPTPPPAQAAPDLLNLVVIPDWHAGMHAWRREAGQDYDLSIASRDLARAMGSIAPRLPPAARGVLLAPGDTTHTNDARNMTPRSGHILDADGRYLKIMEVAAAGLIAATDLMLEHHAAVEVVLLPGNHDPEAALMLALALRMFYSREPRVTVYDGAGLWWCIRHGANMLAATHGHAIKQADMGPYIAASFPDVWGATRYRFCWSGHIHHERSREFPGVLCEALRPVTARDAYAAGAYLSQREISAMTFHSNRGRVSRIYEAIE